MGVADNDESWSRRMSSSLNSWAMTARQGLSGKKKRRRKLRALPSDGLILTSCPSLVQAANGGDADEVVLEQALQYVGEEELLEEVCVTHTFEARYRSIAFWKIAFFIGESGRREEGRE